MDEKYVYAKKSERELVKNRYKRVTGRNTHNSCHSGYSANYVKYLESEVISLRIELALANMQVSKEHLCQKKVNNETI